MKIPKRFRKTRKLTPAEFWIFCFALPALIIAMASSVIALVVMAVNFF